MRIVITGATGNLGTALLRRLRRDGEQHEIVGVCRRPPGGGEPYDGVEWTSVDLADPGAEQALQPVMAGADAVVHLAWGFQPSRDIDYLDRVGIGGSRAVLQSAHAAGVRHLVHISSLGAYSPGPKDRKVDESWPTDGIDTLAYSRQKVAVERLLDEYERTNASGMQVARLRPALVVQRDAGSALLRYFLPFYVPASVLRHIPVLPVDRSLKIQVVHTRDVAEAIALVVEQRATGAFNVAGEPPVTRDDVAAVLGARPVHVPSQALRAIVDATWRARLQPVDPGWLDLAFTVPLMSTERARQVLGWRPTVEARSAVAEVIDGMADTAATASPAMRPRSVMEQALRLVTQGPVGNRKLP